GVPASKPFKGPKSLAELEASKKAEGAAAEPAASKAAEPAAAAPAATAAAGAAEPKVAAAEGINLVSGASYQKGSLMAGSAAAAAVTAAQLAGTTGDIDLEEDDE
ncbi:hypothetical protein HDU96_005273, partial [Phlyctochytrium bullatum]